MTKREWILYELLIGLIALGTAVDIFWTVITLEHIFDQELNPLAKGVIWYGDNKLDLWGLPYVGVALLCCLKVLGTWLVIRICHYLVNHRPRLGWPALGTVAVFQLWLMFYLFFGG